MFDVGDKRTDQIVKLIQGIVALSAIAGAIWTYFDYKREKSLLDNERTRIGNAQILALAEIERKSKYISLQQQKFSLEQSKINSQLESDRSQIAIRQQALALKQSELTAGTEVARQALSVELLKLDQRIKGNELRLTEQGRISYTTDFNIQCTNNYGQYEATLGVTIKNTSTQDVEISWTLLERFLGRTTGGGSFDFLQINPPPIPVVGIEAAGPVTWQSVGYAAHVYYGVESPRSDYEFARGGGMTKVIRPGDEARGRYDFDIWAPPGARAGVSFSWGLDRAFSGDGIFHDRSWSLLPECGGPETKEMTSTDAGTKTSGGRGQLRSQRSSGGSRQPNEHHLD